MQKFILLLLAILSFQATFAQFRVIDAATGEPLVGAYVLDGKGRFLEMSDNEGKVGQHKGQIQISMLSYEAQILDEKQTADVALVQKPFELGEAVIGKAAYIKISGAFRDIVRFDGELVVYREGLVDFYYHEEEIHPSSSGMPTVCSQMYDNVLGFQEADNQLRFFSLLQACAH